MFFVDTGRVHATLDGTLLTEFGSGSAFGEMAFVISCRKVLGLAFKVRRLSPSLPPSLSLSHTNTSPDL